MQRAERVGIIFVHGIGEQRRFEHLEGHLRPLVDALRRRPRSRVTIEILGASSAPYQAEQDTWAANPDPAVRAVVREGEAETHLYFHEVWWADVNEPYSLMKQVRFWAWGLSLWAIPGKRDSDLSGFRVMQPPVMDTWHDAFDDLWMRIRLFLASNVFALAAFSLGALIFLAKRIFGFNAPSLVRVFVNYLGAVKLYSQRRRMDGGFLDAYGEPPRVSIRRRMIRTLADVGSAKYDRWYVFAHSLGSVVAFNGLMENAHCFPNYLDEQRWNNLNRHRPRFAGPARSRDVVSADATRMIPARPLWLKPDDTVYRDKLFAKFSGLLTYGSPLDKFAAIWPARVPINVKEPALAKAEWVNIFDPTDPVSARIDSFGTKQHPVGDLVPANYGIRSHWLLLYSHLTYLRADLADAAMHWVLGGKRFGKLRSQADWYEPTSIVAWLRSASAWLMWAIVYLLLAAVAVATGPLWKSFLAGMQKIFTETVGALADHLHRSTPFWLQDMADSVATILSWLFMRVWSPINSVLDCIAGALPHFPAQMAQVAFGVFLVVLLVGVLARLAVFRRDADDPKRTFKLGERIAGQRWLADVRKWRAR